MSGVRRVIAVLIFCVVQAYSMVFAAGAEVQPHSVSFYFSAHQDDWQLFMNPSAYMDVMKPDTKVVFVYLTAGDAGLGIGSGGRKRPYYKARERGARLAARFMIESAEGPVEEVNETALLNGHLVQKTIIRNTVSYFFRLPDGALSGNGFPSTGHQSLSRLAAGAIPRITAVDASASYDGWADLVKTVLALIDRERGTVATIEINTAEMDEKLNPNDHPDHKATAQAVVEATADLPCARRRYFVEYAEARLPDNLDPAGRAMASAVFAATTMGITLEDHGVNWRWYSKAFLGKNYYREVASTGPCTRTTEMAGMGYRAPLVDMH